MRNWSKDADCVSAETNSRLIIEPLYVLVLEAPSSLTVTCGISQLLRLLQLDYRQVTKTGA